MARSTTNADVPDAPTGVPGSVDEHVALNYDLMHLALQGDISRVFTFLLANEASDLGYSFLDIPESHHVVSHHGNDPVAMDKYTSIVTWHTVQFAGFTRKLAETPDGDGSLLDHTLLYYGSGMSNGNQHDRFTPPAVLLGGANGRLKGNNHLRVEKREPAANLLLNIADIFDVPLDKIGPGNGRLSL